MTNETRRRALGACIAGVVAGLLVAVTGVAPLPAGADQPEENAAKGCESALQGEPDPQLVLTTDPAGGTTVFPGDTIEATLTWGATQGNDVWASIDKVLLCLTVDGVQTEAQEEKPGVDDGTQSTDPDFTVPRGADQVCVHGRVSGQPGPNNSTDSTHKTAQTCFPVAEPCEFDSTIPADDPACGECEEGQLGEYPECEDPCELDPTIPADDPACGECEEGQLGEFPSCVDPECEQGQLGTYPECEDPCELDPTIPADDPACGECAEGETGEFPDCDPEDVCPDMEGDQPEGTDCDPVDGCPEVDGMQEPGTDCESEVLPEVLTPKTPETPAKQPTEVQGAQALPATGANTAPTVQLALGLIALGGVLVARSRKDSGLTR